MLVLGPLIAFGVIAALAAILRWAFDSDVSRIEPTVFADRSVDDYGLLSVTGVADSPDDAKALQERLASAGIRSTTAVGRDGRVRVLVFAAELPAARRVVGGPL
jgi:hypothetical protein